MARRRPGPRGGFSSHWEFLLLAALILWGLAWLLGLGLGIPTEQAGLYLGAGLMVFAVAFSGLIAWV